MLVWIALKPPSEFRRHQKVDNPLYLLGFLSQWKRYLDQIPTGKAASEYKGAPLDPTVFEKVSRFLIAMDMN